MKALNLVVLMSIFSQYFVNIAMANEPIFFMRPTMQQRNFSMPISNIGEDRYGFIWAIGPEGIYRHDGYDMQTFNKINNCITSSQTSTLLLNGNELWIGTWPWSGLYKIDIQTMKVQKIDTSSIRVLFKDSKNNIWAGGLKTLLCINPQTLEKKQYIQGNNLSDNNIRAIYEDRDGNIWIGTNNGLNSLKNGEQTFENHFFDQLPSRCPITSIIGEHVLDDNNLFIGTEYGLIIFNRQNKQYQILNESDGLSNSSIRTLYSKESKIWIGTEFGLNIYDKRNGVIKNYYSESGLSYTLPSNQINHIFESKDNTLWIATENGLCSTNSQNSGIQFHKVSYQHDDLDITTKVRAMVINNQNELWGATEHGIFKQNLDKQTFSSTVEDNKLNKILPQKNLYSLEKDSYGNIWIGTNGGIYVLNSKTNSVTPIKSVNNQILEPHYVGRLYNSGEGIYAAFWEGNLFWLKDCEEPQENVNGNILRNKYATQKFGVFDNKLFFIKDFNLYEMDLKSKDIKEITPISNLLGKRKSEVLFIDKFGILYIGAMGSIIKYDIKSGKHDLISLYPNEHTAIINIASDLNGNIWFSTQSAVYYINPNSRIQVVMMLNENSLVKNFTRGSMLTDSKGTIYIGGEGGYVSFSTQEITSAYHNNSSEKIYITSLKVNGTPIEPNHEKNSILNKDISQMHKICLNHNQNNITLNFSNLSFKNSLKTKYTYILEGYDTQWQITNGNNNEAVYSKLPFGNYTFKVKIDDDTRVNTAISTLTIKIKRPLGLSPFMLLSYFSISIFTLFYFYRIYVKRRRLKEKAEQERIISEFKIDFFTNISHEIRTSVSLISSPINSIINNSENLNEKTLKLLSLAQKNSDRLLRIVHQVFDLRNINQIKYFQVYSEDIDIITFSKQVFNSFEAEAINKNIDFQFITMTEKQNTCVDKQKYETILFNLLSNAFKYTQPGGKIVMKIEITSDQKILTSIVDSGIGISKNDLPFIFDNFYRGKDKKAEHTAGYGIGLSFVKKYIQALGGEITVKSEKDKGSTFTIEMPLVLSCKENRISDNNTDILIPRKIIDYSDNNDGKALVLYVEDNEEMTEMVTLELGHKYNFIIAHNGVEGLEKAIEKQPEIIVSDVMMPEMNGVDMCKELKSNKKTQHIPIIFLTAKNIMSTQIESLRAGVDIYMTKPFEASLLEANIDNLLKRKTDMISYINEELILVKVDNQEITDHDKQFIKKVIEIIDSNLSDQDFNVQKLSSMVGVSRNHLNRKIVAITNITISELIKKYRLQKASLLLRNHTGNIQEIMYYVGFQSSSYFAKCFISEFGMSPKEYQKTRISSNVENK